MVTVTKSPTILIDVIAYICEKYPYAEDLSKAKLTKIIYLADWKSAKDRGRQITDIKWHYNHYGPYVDEVVDVITEHQELFKLGRGTNVYGGVRELVGLKKAANYDRKYKQLKSQEDKDDLCEVITKSVNLHWIKFIKLVYSSYPIRVSERYAHLDLPALAQKYKELKSKPHFELIADNI